MIEFKFKKAEFQAEFAPKFKVKFAEAKAIKYVVPKARG